MCIRSDLLREETGAETYPKYRIPSAHIRSLNAMYPYDPLQPSKPNSRPNSKLTRQTQRQQVTIEYLSLPTTNLLRLQIWKISQILQTGKPWNSGPWPSRCFGKLYKQISCCIPERTDMNWRLQIQLTCIGVWLDLISLLLSVKVGLCCSVDSWNEIQVGNPILDVKTSNGGDVTRSSAMKANESGFAES